MRDRAIFYPLGIVTTIGKVVLDIGGLIETRLQALCFGLEDAWQEPEP